MKKFFLYLVIVLVILSSMLAIAAPAFAAGRCTFVAGHGWHIVGGGSDNDHWFATRALCLAALNPPTPTATLTEEPTETVTATPDPTETIVPTDTVTAEPTETPVVTETPSPTDVPTQEPPIVTETALPTVVATQALSRNGLDCQKAWTNITTTLYARAVGFRFFDNPEHAYCTPWLLKTHGVIWAVYKVQHPLEN